MKRKKDNLVKSVFDLWDAFRMGDYRSVAEDSLEIYQALSKQKKQPRKKRNIVTTTIVTRKEDIAKSDKAKEVH